MTTTTNIADQNVKLAYRPEIDGLRALAVVAVIINHFNGGVLPGGYLGVDVFFVISGFVITTSLAGRQSNNLGDFLLLFYVRRIKRLVPALVIFVVITSVLICMFDSSPRASLRTGMASLLGLSNIYLWKQATDYFSASTELNVFTHTWSLGVEEQFYFLFPLLVWFCGLGRFTTNGSRNMFWVVGVLTVTSLASFIILYQINQPAAYFLMPTRLWELGAGCLVFLGLKNSNSLTQCLRSVPPSLATVCVVAVLFVPHAFAVPATIAVVVLTMTLIFCLRPETTTWCFFTHKQVLFIGRISYSLYLWHWGVLAISRWTIGIHWWLVPFQVALMLLLSILSYRFIETPLRRSNWSARRLVSVGYGISASVGAIGLLLLLSAPLDGRLYLGNLMNIPAPLHLHRTWSNDRRTGEYLEYCHVENSFSSALLNECLGVAPGREGTLYLIGDSHARNYLPALKDGFKEHATAYITMGYGCAFLPPAMSVVYSNVGCSDYVSESAEYLLEKVRKGDVVAIGQRLYDNEERQTTLYMDFIKSFAIRLGEKGVPTILLDDTFPPEKAPEECLVLPWRPFDEREGCAVVSETALKAFARFDQLALDASRQVVSLYYVPLRLGLCDKGVCGQTTATGRPIWHDSGHITEESAVELAPLLRARLGEQGFYHHFSADR